MAILRDNFWLWGQTPGSHHAEKNNCYKLPGVNRMTPAEGCDYLGIPNCCRVVMENMPSPPFDDESRALAHLKQVVWSVVGSGGSPRTDEGWADLEEVIRQAKVFPNITGGVLDDFLNERRRGLFSPEKTAGIKARMNDEVGRSMDLWVVVYNWELDAPIRPYLDACDVITFWNFNGADLADLEETLEKGFSLTPGKRRLAGCYMWDYIGAKPLTIAQMEHQCSVYMKYISRGDIEGIIFCSNCIADLGIEAVEWTRDWIREVGGTKL